MPTYEYACQKCGHEFEQFQSMSDASFRKCPKCGKKALKRLVGAGAGLIFKGSGFYITDYKHKPSGKPEGAQPTATVTNESKPAEAGPAAARPAESKPAESKASEAKAGKAKASEAKPAESKPAAQAKPVAAPGRARSDSAKK